MARKPNYDFERREREKAKAEKVAQRVKAKAEAAEAAKQGLNAPDSEAAGSEQT